MKGHAELWGAVKLVRLFVLIEPSAIGDGLARTEGVKVAESDL